MTDKLIGIYSSVPGCGKTEVTNYLANNHGYRPVKFAGTLKMMIANLLLDIGIEDPRRYTDGDLKEEIIPFFGVSCRHMMQTLGTDWGRALIKPTVWVDVASARIGRLLSEGTKVVVDDMRFPNEYQAIRDLGGVCVRIIRPGRKAPNGHPSEGLLDGHDFDMTLVNDGSIQDLHTITHQVYHKLANAA